MTYALICGDFEWGTGTKAKKGDRDVGTCYFVKKGIESREEAEFLLKQYERVAEPGERYWIVEEKEES